VQTFYERITQAIRPMIDVVAGGTLINKTEDEVYNLIEKMTLDNIQWPNKHGQPKRVVGKFNVDALTLVTAKMDA